MLKASIPFVDLRDKTPIDLLRAYPDKAHELVKAARRTYGLPSYLASLCALPLSDKSSHKWLKRNSNPYLYEIETFADILEARGVYTLNTSYEWGCTSGVYRTDETVSLLRVLDWPFPALGMHTMVVLQKGKAGEFYNMTWPAVSGVFTAMAPGRFSAAINQAPMRKHGAGFVGDWLINRHLVNKETGLPPAHLLRQVFEQADSYETAKQMLMKTPIAMPVIYILAGTNPGEGCIIERLENKSAIAELGAGQQAAASNHFNSKFATLGKGWRPRAQDSEGRLRQGRAIHGYDLGADNFDWLHAPIINQLTKLCVLTDAATHRLTVQGFEGMAPVTELFHLPAESYGQKEVV